MYNYLEIQNQIETYIRNHPDKSEEDIEWPLCDEKVFFDPISDNIHEYINQDSINEMQVRSEIRFRYYQVNDISGRQDNYQNSGMGISGLYAILFVIVTCICLRENVHFVAMIAFIILTGLIIIEHIITHGAESCFFHIRVISLLVGGLSFNLPVLSVIVIGLGYFLEILITSSA